MDEFLCQEAVFGVSRPIKQPFRCLLCKYVQPGSSFVCAKCVNEGNFFKLSDVTRLETYAAGKEKLERLKKEIEEMKRKVLERVDCLSEHRDKVAAKHACRMRLEPLKQAVSESETSYREDLETCKRLHKNKKRLSSEVDSLCQRIKKWETFRVKLKDKILKTHRMHRQTCLDLGRERKKLIDELTTVVIPICRITPLRSVPVQNQLALGSNTQTGVLNGFDATALIVSQLADAVTDAIVENSVCLKTRDSEVQSPDARCEKVSNVFGNHYNGTDWSKVEYSICGITTLTCNRVKDCEDWVQLSSAEELSDDADDVPCNKETPSVLAALSYVAHLVPQVSKILQINVPHIVSLQTFSMYTLTPMALQAQIAKLQVNVLHLCFPLRLPYSVLLPQHILHNLLTCLELPSDMFAGHRSYTFYDDLLPEIPADWETVDVVHEIDSRVIESSIFDENEMDNNDDIDHGEWEAVEPLPEVRLVDKTDDNPEFPMSSSQAGGVLTSTLAQVSNLWRAATGRK